jgi:alcohol dehydrogenase
MAKAMRIKEADKPEKFIAVLVNMQKSCGVAELKMRD